MDESCDKCEVDNADLGEIEHRLGHAPQHAEASQKLERRGQKRLPNMNFKLKKQQFYVYGMHLEVEQLQHLNLSWQKLVPGVVVVAL